MLEKMSELALVQVSLESASASALAKVLAQALSVLPTEIRLEIQSGSLLLVCSSGSAWERGLGCWSALALDLR
jgi:hypothetical protein